MFLSSVQVHARQVTTHCIYFHNNPAMGIGLLPIAVIYLGYISPHENVGPIFFIHTNNQHLIESKSNTTMISVVITTDYETEQIPPSFTSFGLQFNFSSTPLSQALITKIKIFTEPGISMHTFKCYCCFVWVFILCY